MESAKWYGVKPYATTSAAVCLIFSFGLVVKQTHFAFQYVNNGSLAADLVVRRTCGILHPQPYSPNRYAWYVLASKRYCTMKSLLCNTIDICASHIYK